MIYDHFKEVLEEDDVSKEELLAEWSLLKLLIKQKIPKELEGGTIHWNAVNKALQGQGVEIALSIIDLIRTLPPTSVRNECAFSVMKLTKNKQRARLSAPRLNSLMTVSIQGASIAEFDPKPAIDTFMVTSSGRRRRTKGYQRKLKEKEIEKNQGEANTTEDIVVSSDEDNVSEDDELTEDTLIDQAGWCGSRKILDDPESDSDWSEEDEENEEYIDNMLQFYSRD